LKSRVRGKKRDLRNRQVPINDPGRAQYIVEAMRAGRCPDCQTKLIAAYDPGLEDVIETGVRVLECPRCHWQGGLGDPDELPPMEE